MTAKTFYFGVVFFFIGSLTRHRLTAYRMKIILISLIIVHGTLHLFGFMAAIGWGHISQFATPISPWMSPFWFLVPLTIYIAVGMVWLEKKGWWCLTALAGLVSQFLIITYSWTWSLTILCTFVNLILLLVSVPGFAAWHFARRFRHDVEKYRARVPKVEPGMEERLQEEDLAALPEPVQRYLRYVGTLGQVKLHYFEAAMKGDMRQAPDKDWMPFSSMQFNLMDPPMRLFFMEAEMIPLPVANYHRYRAGVAHMDIRGFSLFRLKSYRGAEVNASETVTFLHDMCCLAPVTLIDPRIKWLAVEERRVQLSFTCGKVTVQAWLHFGDDDTLIDFVSEDRATIGPDGTLRRMTWSTPLRDYKNIYGYLLASKMTATYAYPKGPFTYKKLEVEQLRYD